MKLSLGKCISITVLLWTTVHSTVLAQEQAHEQEYPHQVRHRALDSYESRPITRYTPYNQLDVSKLPALTLLQYNQQTWNTPFTAAIEVTRVFNSLTVDEKWAAAAIDCGTAEIWDCYQNHYADYFWIDLPASAKEGYEGLGWTAETFEANIPPPSEDKDWRFLTAAEKQAADKICYFEKLWDEIPLPQWNAPCFSGQTLVQVRDYVRVEGDDQYSMVYSFAHREILSTKNFPYLQIRVAQDDFNNKKNTERSHRPLLEISARHMIYIVKQNDSNNARQLVPAGEVQVGDALLTPSGRPALVTSIVPVERRGAYAPLTISGNVAVGGGDGVLASNYLFAPQVAHAWISYNQQHRLQHAFLTGRRLYCSWFTESCRREQYDATTGLAGHIQFLEDMFYWLEQNGFLPLVVAVVAMPLGGLLWLWETTLASLLRLGCSFSNCSSTCTATVQGVHYLVVAGVGALVWWRHSRQQWLLESTKNDAAQACHAVKEPTKLQSIAE